MQNVLTGEPAALVFDVIDDGQFVSPTPDTVSYTVRNNAGQAISGYEDVAVSTAAGQTTVLISLPGTVNAKTKTFEHRTVTLKATVAGRELVFRQTYRVHDWMPYVASHDEVRSFIGLSEDELRDGEVDLVAAYLALKDELTSIDTYLAAGDLSAIRANRAIVCQSVVDVAQSLPGRAIRLKRSETAQMERFQNADWSRAAADASRELAELKQKLTTSLEVVPTLLTLATPTDTITGT